MLFWWLGGLTTEGWRGREKQTEEEELERVQVGNLAMFGNSHVQEE